jgi:hypothetical protein
VPVASTQHSSSTSCSAVTGSLATSANSNQHGNVKNVNTIIKYLLPRGGWAPWKEMATHFKISEDYSALNKWLLSHQKIDNSFSGRHTEWIRAVNYNAQSYTDVPDEVFFLKPVLIIVFSLQLFRIVKNTPNFVKTLKTLKTLKMHPHNPHSLQKKRC